MVWIVTWRTTGHIMNGNARNKVRRREFVDRDAALAWVKSLEAEDLRAFCCDVAMFDGPSEESGTCGGVADPVSP
jgi:hypothetical protein